jgi:hypothetical protein
MDIKRNNSKRQARAQFTRQPVSRIVDKSVEQFIRQYVSSLLDSAHLILPIKGTCVRVRLRAYTCVRACVYTFVQTCKFVFRNSSIKGCRYIGYRN